MKPNTDTLKVLIPKHDQLLAERDRHAQMVPDLTAEEEKLLPGIDLTNDADFKKLSDLRLRRELAPKKAAQFEDGAVAVEKKIIVECERLANELGVILRDKQAVHRENFKKAIALFISVSFQLDHAVNFCIDHTDVYQKLRDLEFTCSNTVSVNDWEPIKRAGELIAIAEKLADFKV